ncbi:MAG: hypothetical protein ACO1NU_05095 [Arcticibacter sp.]
MIGIDLLVVPTASNSYTLLNLLPGSMTGPLAIANYLSYIPAFTLLMPYLIAVNLSAKSGGKHRRDA